MGKILAAVFWGPLALLCLFLGIIMLLGGLMNIPENGFDFGTGAFTGGGAFLIYIGYKFIQGIRVGAFDNIGLR